MNINPTFHRNAKKPDEIKHQVFVSLKTQLKFVTDYSIMVFVIYTSNFSPQNVQAKFVNVELCRKYQDINPFLLHNAIEST